MTAINPIVCFSFLLRAFNRLFEFEIEYLSGHNDLWFVAGNTGHKSDDLCSAGGDIQWKSKDIQFH